MHDITAVYTELWCDDILVPHSSANWSPSDVNALLSVVAGSLVKGLISEG